MFVDDPDGAVAAADRLVTEVMTARGYPIEDFEARGRSFRAASARVENYRIARALSTRRERGEPRKSCARQSSTTGRSRCFMRTKALAAPAPSAAIRIEPARA
jgi:hypothetical protein